MQRRTLIRKQATRTEREQILDDYRRSGLTQREFALRAGIALSTLQRWLGEAGKSKVNSQGPAFIPVANLLSESSGSVCNRLRLPGGMIGMGRENWISCVAFQFHFGARILNGE